MITFTLSEVEYDRYKSFCKLTSTSLLAAQARAYKHHKDEETQALWTRRTDNWTSAYYPCGDTGIKFIFTPCGVGTAVTLWHKGLNIKCNITDYNSW